MYKLDKSVRSTHKNSGTTDVMQFAVLYICPMFQFLNIHTASPWLPSLKIKLVELLLENVA